MLVMAGDAHVHVGPTRAGGGGLGLISPDTARRSGRTDISRTETEQHDGIATDQSA